MTVLDIVRLGDPVLRTPAEPVGSDELAAAGVVFLDRMRDLRSLCFEDLRHRLVEDSDPTGQPAVG
jgi:hypothetical protein